MKRIKEPGTFDFNYEEENYKRINKGKSCLYTSYYDWHESVSKKISSMTTEELYNFKIRCVNTKHISTDTSKLVITGSLTYATFIINLVISTMDFQKLEELYIDIILQVVFWALTIFYVYLILNNIKFSSSYTFYDNLISIIAEVENKRNQKSKASMIPKCNKRKRIHKACKKVLK